ncbi:MAG TPA: ABC transporter ATP-binding protein [Acidimicrobiales bacterium]|jgi:branched-chain amino acid transport system ATP-binding protein|nr:ABC transporter ATP-binding protein [Acidimicrobiales bacterium]
MLEVKNLTAGYGAVTVLRDVSLTCETGLVVALLGPNGAGKTTLLRAISGLLRPRSGNVVFNGHDVTSSRPTELARAGLCHIPEGRGVFPSLSVRENLRLFASPGRDEVEDSLARALESFPALEKRLGQTAGSLSGGEQQMLALTRAYITNPRLVLVDEASMGLAPMITDRVFEFLRRVAAEGTTLLMVEQYVSQALEMSDTVYLLNQGSIVFGRPAKGLTSEEIYAGYLGVGA